MNESSQTAVPQEEKTFKKWDLLVEHGTKPKVIQVLRYSKNKEFQINFTDRGPNGEAVGMGIARDRYYRKATEGELLELGLRRIKPLKRIKLQQGDYVILSEKGIEQLLYSQTTALTPEQIQPWPYQVTGYANGIIGEVDIKINVDEIEKEVDSRFYRLATPQEIKQARLKKMFQQAH